MDDRDGFTGLIDGVVEPPDGLAELNDGFNGVSVPGVGDVRIAAEFASAVPARAAKLGRAAPWGVVAGWAGAGCAGVDSVRDAEPVRDPPQLREDVLAALGLL